MLCPIAQKPTRGCTGRLERPMCEKIQPVAFCRTSVIMSKEERGAVVATASKKAAFLASSSEQVVQFNSITGPTGEKPNVRKLSASRC